MDDIQRADPVARRRAVLLVVIGSMIGGAALLAGARYRGMIEQWLLSDPERLPRRLAVSTALIVFLTVVPVFGFAAHLWLRGGRIRRQRRFPPEGERVVRDTALVRGEAAATRGRILQGSAVALAMAAVGLAVALWRLAVTVIDPMG